MACTRRKQADCWSYSGHLWSPGAVRWRPPHTVPALLDAATGVLNDRILVCYRDIETGLSHVVPMSDLPQYYRDMAKGAIGDNVMAGCLTGPVEDQVGAHAFDEVFGIA